MFLCSFTGGCSSWSLQAGAEQPSFEEMLSAPYDETRLKESVTLDVLPRIQRSQGELAPYFTGAELLSQSENVVASSGQAEDGRRIWFNMAAFHEFRLNVIRKYFFVVDDTGPTLSGKPRCGLRFDCEMALPDDVSGKSYADESARQIALLRYVLENLHKDIEGLDVRTDARGQNDKTLTVCGMLINQTFEIILRELESSPALAAKLSGAGGVELDHITFDKGAVRMAADGETVAIRIRFGIFAPPTRNNQ
ncbi:MAG: hypothetical protein ACYSWQ_26650 [Planctomycetota bacterium]